EGIPQDRDRRAGRGRQHDRKFRDRRKRQAGAARAYRRRQIRWARARRSPVKGACTPDPGGGGYGVSRASAAPPRCRERPGADQARLAAIRRSSTKRRYSAAFSASPRSLSSSEGWIVTKSGVPSASSPGWPRSLEIVTGRPIKLRAAVAPSATIAPGWTRPRSISSHHLHRSISCASGRLCRRRLPRCSYLKCLTALVTKTLPRSEERRVGKECRSRRAR